MNLTDDQLATLRATAEVAHDEVVRLCEGGRWRMTIPVDQEHDSDIVITAALRGIPALLDEVAALRAKVGAVEEVTRWAVPSGYAGGHATDTFHGAVEMVRDDDLCAALTEHEGCDCAELCSMGPTCPAGMLAGLPGSGCHRTADPTVSPEPVGEMWPRGRGLGS